MTYWRNESAFWANASLDVATTDTVIFHISATGAGVNVLLALNNGCTFNDMFWTVRTVSVLAFVVLTLTHVVDGSVEVLSELRCVLLLCRI